MEMAAHHARHEGSAGEVEDPVLGRRLGARRSVAHRRRSGSRRRRRSEPGRAACSPSSTLTLVKTMFATALNPSELGPEPCSPLRCPGPSESPKVPAATARDRCRGERWRAPRTGPPLSLDSLTTCEPDPRAVPPWPPPAETGPTRARRHLWPGRGMALQAARVGARRCRAVTPPVPHPGPFGRRAHRCHPPWRNAWPCAVRPSPPSSTASRSGAWWNAPPTATTSAASPTP